MTFSRSANTQDWLNCLTFGSVGSCMNALGLLKKLWEKIFSTKQMQYIMHRERKYTCNQSNHKRYQALTVSSKIFSKLEQKVQVSMVFRWSHALLQGDDVIMRRVAGSESAKLRFDGEDAKMRRRPQICFMSEWTKSLLEFEESYLLFF